jgi:hypothetical protein
MLISSGTLAMKPPISSPSHNPSEVDLDALLHPAQAFQHPDDVVSDPDLTLNEKRAILASWASDACAVEAAPALRRPVGSARPVAVDDILAALRALDREANSLSDAAWRLRRMKRKRALPRWGRRENPGAAGSPASH